MVKKEKPMSKIGQLFKDLDLNEDFQKAPTKEKAFTHVKDQIPKAKGLNYMADLLMLPETKEGYKYGLVVVDLASNNFDIEPLKKKEPEEVLKALKAMFKRKYIKEPDSSIQTDGGSEFKGKMKQWMYDESILHKTALPDRHNQMANVESLNKLLGRIFNTYMNNMEIKTGKQYNEWTDIVEKVRTELNKARQVELPADWTKADYKDVDISIKPKFKVGDVVYRLLDAPKNALGHDQNTKAFRSGDIRWDVKQPRKITQVMPYSGPVPYRYMIEGIENASFTDKQLMLAPEQEKESKYTIKEIIGEKTEKKKKYYLVWWNKYKKDESTWEPETQLKEDIGEEDLKTFVSDFRKSKNKKKDAPVEEELVKKKPVKKEPVKKEPVKKEPAKKKEVKVVEEIKEEPQVRRSSRLAKK